MKTKITFFITDLIERLTFDGIKNEAERRGYETQFSYDLSEPAQLGFYCCHTPLVSKVNAEFSVVMLHDIGQGQERWPNFWQYEPWDNFDLGLLPGPSWKAMYDNMTVSPNFPGPLLGAFDVGWPKSDRLFTAADDLANEAALARKQLNLAEGKVVLYAPSWENDGKQDDFVNSCLDIGCNLLVKQAPWPDSHPEIVKNIDQMEAKYRNYHPRLHIMNRETDIITALALSDVIVTDESCVMFEALLFNIPSISVRDWIIPDCTPPRFSSAPHDFVIQSSKSKLREDVSMALDYDKNSNSTDGKMAGYRAKWFSHMGSSAVACMDLVEWLYCSQPYKTAIENTKLSAKLLRLEQKLEETEKGLASITNSLQATNKKLLEYKTLIDFVNQSRTWRYTRPIRRMIEKIENLF